MSRVNRSFDLDEMSPRQRFALFGVLVVLAVGIGAWVLWPASDDSPSSASDEAQPTGTSTGAAPSESKGSAGSSSVALPFSPDEIDAAADVATEWAAGIASLRWDEDQQSRTDKLVALLADVNDVALARLTSPSQIQLDQFEAAKRVIVADAEVKQVTAVSAGSIVFDVEVSQSVYENGTEVSTANDRYLVTVVPVSGSWRVAAMGSTDQGDKGYGG